MSQYYAKQQGLRSLGLQPLPSLQVSEQNAKSAIQMQIYLTGLKDTVFGREPWTLSQTSKELVLQTEPYNTFKKQGYTVKVYYDNDRDNANFYTNWDRLYYMDSDGNWQVTEGLVDHEGLYWIDDTGFKKYFQYFQPDAERFGVTGQWTVQYRNTTISSVVTSTSTRDASEASPRPHATHSLYSTSVAETPRARESPSSTTATSPRGGRRQRQGKQQSNTPTRRSVGRRGASGSWVAPEEVGKRSTTVSGTGHGRLGRLAEEARDPPIIIVKGPANTLKCWRHRTKKYKHLLLNASSVWRWVESPANVQSRMLVAFTDFEQRKQFLLTVRLPKTCTYDTGYLNSL